MLLIGDLVCEPDSEVRCLPRAPEPARACCSPLPAQPLNSFTPPRPRTQVDSAVASHLLPGLVTKIADAKVVVRKAASQALVAYMHSTRDKEAVMNCLLRSGLESSEWKSRQACALFLSLPTTPLDAIDSALQRELVRATIALLSDPVDAVTTSAKQALSQLRVAFSAEFAAHVRALPPALRSAFEVYEAGGDPKADADAGAPADGASLEFGIVGARLMGQLHEVGNWQVRAQAIAELQKLIGRLSAEQHAAVVPHVDRLATFLMGLLDDSNFKISLTSLQIISDMLEPHRFQAQMRSSSGGAGEELLRRLMEKFADNKIVIRQQNLKVMRKLLVTLTPERGTRLLLPYAHHANSHIREQAVHVLIQTLLGAPAIASGADRDLCRALLTTLTAALDDAKPKVKLSALELAAVLHDAMGSAGFSALRREVPMSEAHALAVDERLRQGKGTLPTMSNDGLVEFTTQPGLQRAGTVPLPAGPRAPSAGRALASAGGGIGGGRAGAPASMGGGMGGGGGGDGGLGGADFSDLSEVTAGGRRIATSRNKLPWEPVSAPRSGTGGSSRHSATGSRCSNRASSISGIDRHSISEAPDEAAMGEGAILQDRRIRQERGASALGMRIEVPASLVGGVPGPLSAPTEQAPWRSNYGRGGGGPGGVGGDHPFNGDSFADAMRGLGVGVDSDPRSDLDGLGFGAVGPSGRGTPTPSMGGAGSGPGSPQRELLGGEQAKIRMWLPEGGQGPTGGAQQQGIAMHQQTLQRPQPSRRSAPNPATGLPAGMLPPSLDGPFGLGQMGLSIDGAGLAEQTLPADSLKLLKRNRAAAPGAASSAIDPFGNGRPMLANDPFAQRAVSAAGKAPQVRLPFEREPQRSSSAPHKRTLDNPERGGPDPQQRLAQYADSALGGGAPMPPPPRGGGGMGGGGGGGGGMGGAEGGGGGGGEEGRRQGRGACRSCGGGGGGGGRHDGFEGGSHAAADPFARSIAPGMGGHEPSAGPGMFGGPSGARRVSGLRHGRIAARPSAENTALRENTAEGAPSAADAHAPDSPRPTRHHAGNNHGGNSHASNGHGGGGACGLQLDGVSVSRSADPAVAPSESSRQAARQAEAPAAAAAPAAAPAAAGGGGSGHGSRKNTATFSPQVANLEPDEAMPAPTNAAKIEELRTEDLKAQPPPSAPTAEVVRAALEQLRGDDWAEQFDAINTLRRMLAWQGATPDPALLTHLHSLVLLMIQFSDSLRSALAKNACMCFKEMFTLLQGRMEADLDLIAPVLIKKSAESNGFICDEANKALHAMIVHVSESRCTAALVACSTHRNQTYRAKAALHLSRALEQQGYAKVLQSRELEKVVPVFASLLSEGLSETRAAAKQMVAALMREAAKNPADAERLERLLSRHIDGASYRKLRDSISSVPGGADGLIAGGQHLQMNGGASRKSEGRRASTDSARASVSSAAAAAPEAAGGGGGGGAEFASAADALEGLPGVLTRLSSSDWAERKQGVTSLTELVEGHAAVLVARGKLLTIFDHFTPRLTDQNSKVNVAALQALARMVPPLRDGLPSVTASVLPALATSLASGNAQVRGATPPLLDTLLSHVDHAALIPPLANCALYANPKARPAMVDRLRAVSHQLYPIKPQLVVKHAVPAAFRLLEENRTDTRAGTVLLLRTLYAAMGDVLFEHAMKIPPNTQQRLHELIQVRDTTL